MAYVKFADRNDYLKCTVSPSGNTVALKFPKGTPVVVNTNGFRLYLDKDGKMDIGGESYLGFTTVYRNDEVTAKYNGYQLSNDGSVYVKPLPVVQFAAGYGGNLKGDLQQEAELYQNLAIPVPVPDEDFEFVEWVPEIPLSGQIDGNKSFTAIFKSLIPEPEPVPSIEERVTDLETDVRALNKALGGDE